ncbi:MAG TPA: CopD family protein [Candidatus Udaeobacter sp.]|nr:CopD family protein [Candidatus Udaeobacter sp.]
MSGSPDLLAAASHWLEYLGLLGAVGSVVVQRLADMKPRLGWARPPAHIAFAAALSGGALLLIHGPSWALAVRVGVEVAGLYACLSGGRLAAPCAVLAAAILPLTSHASAPPFPGGPEFVDALHVLSAGMWAGGIVALATLRPPGGWRGSEAGVLLDRFGRVAFIAFGITALTGVLRATEQLSQVSDLWTTTYGTILLLKSAGVVAMVVLSSIGWRRAPRVAGVEAAAAGAVVGLTALLAALPVGGR